jgi:hypothetical protein
LITGELLAGGSARAEATTLGPFAQGYDLFGTFGERPTFTLSPHTEFLLTGTADVSAAVSPGGHSGEGEGAVEFGIGGPSPDIPFRHDYLSAIASDLGLNSVSSSGDLSVAFFNTSDVPVDGFFYVYVWADAIHLSPIPEPTNLTLMLGALGGMALAIRRRRQSR